MKRSSPHFPELLGLLGNRWIALCWNGYSNLDRAQFVAAAIQNSKAQSVGSGLQFQFLMEGHTRAHNLVVCLQPKSGFHAARHAADLLEVLVPGSRHEINRGMFALVSRVREIDFTGADGVVNPHARVVRIRRKNLYLN